MPYEPKAFAIRPRQSCFISKQSWRALQTKGRHAPLKMQSAGHRYFIFAAEEGMRVRWSKSDGRDNLARTQIGHIWDMSSINDGAHMQKNIFLWRSSRSFNRRGQPYSQRSVVAARAYHPFFSTFAIFLPQRSCLSLLCQTSRGPLTTVINAGTCCHDQVL